MKDDRKINTKKANVYSQLNGLVSKTVNWQNVKMGSILEIKKDEEFPADMVLLYAEDNENQPLDMVFVETINLDGESNLKPRTIIDS